MNSNSCPICNNPANIPKLLQPLVKQSVRSLQEIKELLYPSEYVDELTHQLDQLYKRSPHNQYFHSSPFLEVHNYLGSILTNTPYLVFCPQHQHIFFVSVKEYESALILLKAQITKIQAINPTLQGEDKILAFMEIITGKAIQRTSELITHLHRLLDQQYLIRLSSLSQSPRK